MNNNLYKSLIKVFHKLKNANFIIMNALLISPVTSDDLKAFNDYFKLEPARTIHGDWDILVFKKDGKMLVNEDYKKMREQVEEDYNNLINIEIQKQESQIPKKLKYDDYGWLSPKGEYYSSEWGTHQEKAKELIDNLGYSEEYELESDLSETYLSTGDFLQKFKHFILIHSPSNGIPYPTYEGRLTKVQKEFLFEFYSERNLSPLANKYSE